MTVPKWEADRNRGNVRRGKKKIRGDKENRGKEIGREKGRKKVGERGEGQRQNEMRRRGVLPFFSVFLSTSALNARDRNNS